MGIKTGKKALFTEINITPLTDIFLVLLIIMMGQVSSFIIEILRELIQDLVDWAVLVID